MHRPEAIAVVAFDEVLVVTIGSVPVENPPSHRGHRIVLVGYAFHPLHPPPESFFGESEGLLRSRIGTEVGKSQKRRLQ